MAILLNNVAVNQPPGTVEYGPVAVPDGASRYIFSVKRNTTATPTIWPNTSTTLAATIVCSLDNWASEIAVGGCTPTPGGISPGLHGGEATESRVLASLPAGTGRQIKARVTVGGPINLVSNLTVEVL